MATQAHCAYAFECLAASFEHRQPLGLTQVEELWEQYNAGKTGELEDEEEEDQELEGEEDENMIDEEVDEPEPPPAKPAAISRLLNGGSSATSSSSSLPSTRSSNSSSTTDSRSSGADTPGTSRSSLFSLGRSRRDRSQNYPLFVTWNIIARGGYKSLRGCIGTFEPQELEYGLRSYALTRYTAPSSTRLTCKLLS